MNLLTCRSRRWPLDHAIPLVLLAAALAGRSAAQGGATQRPRLDQPAATVNGEVITVDQWVQRMEKLRFQDFVATVNPILAKPDTAGTVALETLINGRLLMQYGAKVGLLPKDSEVDAELERVKKQPAIEQSLKNGLFTEAQLREDLRLQQTYYNVVTINQRVAPEEVKAYYDRHPEISGRPEQWRLRLIRVTGKSAADTVSAQLKKGTAFDKVATDLSEDLTTKKNGGDIGAYNANDPNLPAYLKEAIGKLKVGENTPPILIPNSPMDKPAFLFVRLVAKADSQQKPFEELKPQLERAALLEKVGGGQAKIAELRKDAIIVIHMPAYQDILKKQAPAGAAGTPGAGK